MFINLLLSKKDLNFYLRFNLGVKFFKKILKTASIFDFD